MEITFKKYLHDLPYELYEYRYIIFEFLQGKFIILKNKKNFRIFMKDNDIFQDSKYFKEIFKLNKFVIGLPEYINIRDIHMKFINCYLLCDGVFYLNYIKHMKFYEFNELIILLDYFDLMKFDIKRILCFYREIIEISHDMSIVNYHNIKIGHLILYGDELI